MENDPLVAQMEDLELEQSNLFAQPKLLFTRPKVYVETSTNGKEGMPGFMSLIETTNYEHILSWTPEAAIPGLDQDSYVDISSEGEHDSSRFVAPPRTPEALRSRSFHPSDYAVSVPLQSIYSLLVYPPRIKDRQGSIIINLIGGESLPAFYFHDDGLSKGKGLPGTPPTWGGQDLLNHLEQLVEVVGSAIEPGVYLVNASRADKINHGAASPSLPASSPLLSGVQDHPLREDSLTGEHESLYPDISCINQSTSLSSIAAPALDTATSTATGPITVEGMRRRRSLTESSRSNSPGTGHRQFVSTTGSPSIGSPGSFSGRPRTPLPFENHIDPLVNTVKEMRWNILERFSQVARFSRDAATNILDHPITKQILPPHVQQRIQESEAAKRVMDDYDSARVYLAKWAATVADQSDKERREVQEMDRLRQGSSGTGSHPTRGRSGRRINDYEDEEGPLGAFNVLDLETECTMIHHTRTDPLSPMDWFSFFDDQGRLKVSEAHVREVVFRGGIEHDIRIEVWKFFLGIYPWDSTESERVALRVSKAEEYYALKREWFDDASVQEDEAFLEQKLRIEKDVHRTDRTISFFASETLPNFSGDFTGVGSNENLELLKDILLTYNVWAAKSPSDRAASTDKAPKSLPSDGSAAGAALSSPVEPNLLEGYVQGMSDLLAPVFAVMGDEVMGFWAFVGLMEKTKKNFYRDQVGMQSQLETLCKMIQVLDPKLYKHLEKCEALNLFFCFRWLLIWFKREFEWVDIMRLWEVLFSDHLSTQFQLFVAMAFQLFVAMAVLDKQRDVMIDHLQGFDEILKYVNDLSMTIDLEETLQNAEILYRRLEHVADKIEAKRRGQSANSDSGTEANPELPLTLRKLLKETPPSTCT
ncbi:GTPase activating protein [Linnemannia schmuckeri]|uniref:GTPase activating protein n=1 Tax=Linnemannia schmuckeri TaxID=64567 RepID=A0A9P5V8C7_9FUNG|nr:GTPase activating protein [Linnemannia schmuckeri]